MSKKWINVFIAADDNYAQHAVVMLTSMFENTMYKEDIRVFLVSNGVSATTTKNINETVVKYGGSFQNIVIDANEVADYHVEREMTSAAYFRLYAANILPSDVDRVIYSDVDVVIVDDIKNLWDISLDGHPVGAVVDQGLLGTRGKMAKANRNLGLPEDNLYFYSGLLLIDLRMWRDNNYSNQLITLAKNNKFAFHDQDAINKFFAGNIKELPSKWVGGDFLMAVHIKSLFLKEFRKRWIPLSRFSIFHYCAEHKPWEYDELDGYNDLYYKYLKMSCLKKNTCPRKDKKKMKRFMRRVFFTKILDKVFGGKND